MKNQPGAILIIGIIFMAVILIISASLFSRVADFLRFNSGGILKEQASTVAEGGVDYAIWKLNALAGSCGSGATVWCNVETAVGTTGSFEVAVVDKTSSLKTLTVTGYIPNKANPRSKRTIKLDTAINSTIISFNYAVQTGDGGIHMQNSSEIKGNVYTNGSITGTNSPVITKDAWAVGNISTPPIVQGTKHANASPEPMPSIGPPCDVQCWKDTAAAGGTITCPCTYSSDQTYGPKKFEGNLTVQNTARLTITGPLWVTGNVTVKNSASIKLADSFGSIGTALVADGKISTENSGAFIPTNADPKGYILVISESTANDAILIKNSGTSAIFYALNGGASLENSARVTALVAKKLETKNTAVLTYDLGLTGGQFSSGPGGSWQIKKGTYRFSQ